MYSRFLYTIWIVGFLFIASFCPPLLPFNTIYIASFFALLWLFGHNRNGTVIKVPEDLFYLLFVFVLYVIVIMLLNMLFEDNSALLTNRIIVVYQILILIPMQFFCAKYVAESARLKNYGTDTILKLVVLSGLVEVMFVVLAFVSPTLRSVFLSSIIKRGGIERVYADSTVLTYRSYGWADTLLDTFGYGMGILAGLCLLCKKVGKTRYIYMILFLFATALNSRTGFVIFMIAVLIWFIPTLRKCRIITLIRAFLVLAALILIGVIAVRTELINTSTLSWITTGFESFWNLLTGKTVAYHTGSLQNSLFSARFWHFPDTILGFLFGNGHSVFGTRSILGISSDVGYVNYIWICGIFGTGLLLFIIFKWFKNGIRSTRDPELKVVRVFLCVSFFVMFIKGNVITHTVGTFLTIMLMTINDSNYSEYDGDNMLRE